MRPARAWLLRACWPLAALVAVAAGSLGGCGSWSPPEPPPADNIPIAPPHQRVDTSDGGGGSAPLATDARGGADAAIVATAAPETGSDSVEAPSGPRVTIAMETPYKMDQREEPKTREAYKQDIFERRHWNSGGMGELLAEAPGPEGHPDPRVRVNIEKVHGPHEANTLQRIARKFHWINVVRCYRLGAYKDPHLRGWTHARIDVSKGGKVRGAKLLDTELDVKEVADCMVDKLGKLEFPSSRAGSRAWVDMKVSPGDDPMPPPDELLVPGDGELELDEMRLGVQAGLRDFEACYRSAFSYAPGLWGRLLIRFHVDDKGQLDEAFEAGSRFPDLHVSQCVLRAARKLKFPRPRGGDIRFYVPLRFYTDRAVTD